jgi:hypothetical protein
MSLQAPVVYCQPEETLRVARAAFPRGNSSMRIYDALGPIYRNPQFARLFPEDGQPALAPAQLAPVRVPYPSYCLLAGSGRGLAGTGGATALGGLSLPEHVAPEWPREPPAAAGTRPRALG